MDFKLELIGTKADCQRVIEQIQTKRNMYYCMLKRESIDIWDILEEGTLQSNKKRKME